MILAPVTYYLPPFLSYPIESASWRVGELTKNPNYNFEVPGLYDSCPQLEEVTTVIEEFYPKIGDVYITEYLPESGEEGGVKWRLSDGQPYAIYPLLGDWQNYASGDSVETISTMIGNREGWVEQLIEKGYEVHKPMDIPFYRYPTGESARKIGFSKENYNYLFGFYDVNPEEYESIMGKDPPANTVSIKVFCTQIEPALSTLYSRYMALPHDYSNETAVSVEEYDKLLVFALQYPGANVNWLKHEFYKQEDGGKLRKIYESEVHPPCRIFEQAGAGRGMLCLKSNGKEFGVVEY